MAVTPGRVDPAAGVDGQGKVLAAVDALELDRAFNELRLELVVRVSKPEGSVLTLAPGEELTVAKKCRAMESSTFQNGRFTLLLRKRVDKQRRR